MENIEGNKLIFRGIVGSTCYGLNTPESDIDYKSVYIQDNELILSNRYEPQINLNADDTAFELRRLLELLMTGNPNVLELLYLPKQHIVFSSPEWELLLEHRQMFLSKLCYDTYSGYAKTQLNKASGLNKKFNWEKERTERKDIMDFAKIVTRVGGKTYLIKEFCELNDIDVESIGLTSIDGFRDSYKVYVGDYGGMMKENSNQPRKSIVKKEDINDWVGILYFNREAYSTHCKDYNKYQKWLRDRNENRVATNKKHGQDFDGKNIMHTVRLIITGREIPLLKKINVDRSEERDFLLSIKKGEINLSDIIEEWSEKVNHMKLIYDVSDLPDEVNVEAVKDLELLIRTNGK